MATPPAKRKLFSLNVKQKREICIYHIENPGKTQKQIAEFFCAKFGEVVGKRTIGNILANMQLWMNQVTHPGSAKRLRYAKYGRLEEALQVWYADARMTNLEISDSVLKEKAKEIGSELGMDYLKLKYSNGWLHRFKNRCVSKSFIKSYNREYIFLCYRLSA
ncbi:tigger transposable element-derived protein 4 [Biomphalaria pfeifferi]|uniref:Tigger transposable element-derived protein 4 n=1 Tax=Biomphalaria pfeifferi TaxID=112525 RepID=A0AAD8FIZ2_BIOPF|nr:tigger transposable element-derived protein 4 [Biomphalaria pfeifferi]